MLMFWGILGEFFGVVYSAFEICVSIGVFMSIRASQSALCYRNIDNTDNILQGWGKDAGM